MEQFVDQITKENNGEGVIINLGHIIITWRKELYIQMVQSFFRIKWEQNFFFIFGKQK